MIIAVSELMGTGRLAPRLIHPVAAWTLLVVTYVLGYGLPVWSSVVGLMHAGTASGASSEQDRIATLALFILWQLVFGAFCIAVLWGLRVWVRRMPGADLDVWSVVARPSTSSFARVSVVIATITLAFAVAVSLGRSGILGDVLSRPSSTDGSLELAIWDLVYSVIAGPMEEVGVLLIPIVLLRSAGQGWPIVYGTCIALRLGFHLDYGIPTVAGLALWAALMVTLYRATGDVVAFLVAHGLYNGLTGLALIMFSYVHGNAGQVLGETFLGVRWSLAAVGFVVMLLFTCSHLVRERGGLDRPQGPDAASSP